MIFQFGQLVLLSMPADTEDVVRIEVCFENGCLNVYRNGVLVQSQPLPNPLPMIPIMPGAVIADRFDRR